MKDKDYDEYMKNQLWPGLNTSISNLLTLNVSKYNADIRRENKILKENLDFYEGNPNIQKKIMELPILDFFNVKEDYKVEEPPETSLTMEQKEETDKLLEQWMKEETEKDINNNSSVKVVNPSTKLIITDKFGVDIEISQISMDIYEKILDKYSDRNKEGIIKLTAEEYNEIEPGTFKVSKPRGRPPGSKNKKLIEGQSTMDKFLTKK